MSNRFLTIAIYGVLCFVASLGPAQAQSAKFAITQLQNLNDANESNRDLARAQIHHVAAEN